jgi:hypothetical protein
MINPKPNKIDEYQPAKGNQQFCMKRNNYHYYTISRHDRIGTDPQCTNRTKREQYYSQNIKSAN